MLMAKTFVEIGSADFDTCLPLAKAGWRGICVEPVPYLFKSVSDIYRNYEVTVMNYAISDASGELTMAVGRNNGWLKGCSHIISENHLGYKLSTHPDHINNFNEKINVNCMTLDDLLHDFNEIDFLKIDAEGHETNIFMNYSFRVKPKVIKVEHKHIDDIALCKKLTENGYLVWTEKHDIYGII
jgi:FkbM family methyltransferase